jgi:hypothetical protein
MKIRFHSNPFPTHTIYPRLKKTYRAGSAFTQFFPGAGLINPIIYKDLEENSFSGRYILKLRNNMSHNFRKPKPFSEARRAAARANGAKSHGPVTPEGKAKSALNSTTHGLTGTALALTTESKEKYEALLAAYRDEYCPQGPVENALVAQVASAEWLQRRALEMITALLDVTMDRMAKEITAEFQQIDNATRTALAFAKQADQSTALSLLHRYAARHARDYHRALDKLRQIQSECGAGPRPAAGSQPAKTPAQDTGIHLLPETSPKSNTTNMQNEPKPDDAASRTGQPLVLPMLTDPEPGNGVTSHFTESTMMGSDSDGVDICAPPQTPKA